MANSKLIQNTVTKSLPHFPELSTGKTRRCFTKHFSNTSLWLFTDEYSLLYWLVYQTAADNTFKYSTGLLKQYSKTVEFIKKEYDSERFINTNITHVRKCLKELIEKGLVLQTSRKGILMINPMLTYNLDVMNSKNYKSVVEMYQVSSPEKITVFTDYFGNLVKQFLESKKPNYKYGKRKQ